uniref:Uncharacterized protein n=1 Tax=Amphimedon queenslandica TaxID=400682 RepID=A0A1X7T7K2_AMPQE
MSDGGMGMRYTSMHGNEI